MSAPSSFMTKLPSVMLFSTSNTSDSMLVPLRFVESMLVESRFVESMFVESMLVDVKSVVSIELAYKSVICASAHQCVELPSE